MQSKNRLSVSALLLLCVGTACDQSHTLPALDPVTAVTARIYENEELGQVSVESVTVPDADIKEIADLVTPSGTPFEIHPEVHPHVADVFLKHKDGSDTKVSVYWTGHNPAAVSFDNQHFYLGGISEFPDGAVAILRLLNRVRREQSGHN